MPLSRSPSPQAQRPELRAHQPLETSAVGTTIEERVDKLEEMARRDHLWRDDVAGAVKALAQASDRSYAKLRDYGEAISGFGRVGFDIRSDLNAAKAKLEADLIAGLEEVPTRMAAFFSGGPGVQIGILLDKLGHQVMQLDAKFEVLHEHIGGAAGRETLMAAKLHELDAARPQEGAAIAAALQRQAQQISEIKPSGESEWTLEKLNLLDRMYRDVAELKNLPGRLKFMEDRLTAASQDLASSSVTGVYQEIEVIKAQLQEATSQANVGTAPCQPCGGTHVGGSGGGWASCGLTPSGGAGSSSDGDQWFIEVLKAVTRGNGTCHCVHVNQLQEKVAVLEAAARVQRTDSRGPDLLQHTGWRPTVATAPTPAPGQDKEKEKLPLVLKDPLGAIGYEKRGALFDEKLATSEDYKFNGVRGGLAWKGKVE